MKDREYAALICAGYCSFYREGKKEEMHCGTFGFLRAHLTAHELRSLISLAADLPRSAAPDFSRDDEMKTLICDACEFHIDGCDFREDRSGPPCGGYVIVEKLLQ
jgi:hypothetical protein